MDWVKRNLGFVIGSVVAVGLLLFSGFYLYSNSNKNNNARKQLEAEYSELQRLSNLTPHPGKGDVDNISRAREQQEELVDYIKEVRDCFEPIPAIPASERVTGEEFSASLRRTIDQLHRRARVSSVILPTNYNFSFEAEKRLVKFAPGSLNALAVQLGEVKAICDVLFAAKVNQVNGLRRERVSPDDLEGPQTDYLTATSVTNDLAVVSPYEITFESFSAELAQVIAGFANTPYGMVIQGMNIQPADAAVAPIGTRRSVSGYTSRSATPSRPIYTPQTSDEIERGGVGAYPGRPGAGSYGDRGSQPQYRQPTFRQPTFGGGQTVPGYVGGAPSRTYQAPAAPTYPTAGNPYAAAVSSTDGTQTLIDEHPLRVTIIVKVIKLLPMEDAQDL